MRPVKHAGSNMVYRGNGAEIGDLWCMRQKPGHIDVVYEFDDNERKMIADGGKILLSLHHEPIPPVSMTVMPDGFCDKIEDHPFHVADDAG